MMFQLHSFLGLSGRHIYVLNTFCFGILDNSWITQDSEKAGADAGGRGAQCFVSDRVRAM